MITPILDKIEELENLIKFMQPKDRSPIDRKYAIVLTDLEKIKSYVGFYLEAE